MSGGGNVRRMEHRFAGPPDGGDDLDALVALSNAVGADPSLTQPGGGNSSIKRRALDFAGRDKMVIGREKGRAGIAAYSRQKSIYWGLDENPLAWA